MAEHELVFGMARCELRDRHRRDERCVRGVSCRAHRRVRIAGMKQYRNARVASELCDRIDLRPRKVDLLIASIELDAVQRTHLCELFELTHALLEVRADVEAPDEAELVPPTFIIGVFEQFLRAPLLNPVPQPEV